MGQGFAIDAKRNDCISNRWFCFKYFSYKTCLRNKTKSGIEILVHVGIDTVELNGEGFDIKVQEGQKLRLGIFL